MDGFSPTASDELARQIQDSEAQIVLVALGNPLQEEWIAAHGGSLAAPLILGVGAFFDFIGGSVPRAPAWMRRLCLEWLHRWGHEPDRLARRYTVEMTNFFRLVLWQARDGRNRARP